MTQEINNQINEEGIDDEWQLLYEKYLNGELNC